MKSLLVVTLLWAVPCYAQRRYLNPVNGTTLPATTLCYQGTNNDFIEQSCHETEDMCSITLRIDDGLSFMDKSCTTRDKCLTDQRSNRQLCTGFDVSSGKLSTCSFCCVGRLCNFFSTVTELQEANSMVSSISITG